MSKCFYIGCENPAVYIVPNTDGGCDSHAPIPVDLVDGELVRGVRRLIGKPGNYGIQAVDPKTPDALICGDPSCGKAWLEDITPSGRCPWEYDHADEKQPEILSCGHMSSPTQFTPGYATLDGQRICYTCAADEDRKQVGAMTKPSDALFAYVKVEDKVDFTQRVKITSWPGIVLGTGTMNPKAHPDSFGNPRHYVHALVTDDSGFRVEMWGWYYPQSGDYVRLRPFIASLRKRAASIQFQTGVAS